MNTRPPAQYASPEHTASDTCHDDTPVSRSVLKEAIAWQLDFDGSADQGIHNLKFQRWLAAAPEHARAWRQLTRLNREFTHHATLPARTALTRPRSRPLKTSNLIAIALLVTSGLFAVHRVHPLPQLTADLRTATGEVRHHTLADGSELSLNTRTAVDLEFSPNQRRIVLRAGEIYLQTTVTSRADPRPLLVVTPHGSIQPLGTRFLVRHNGSTSEVSVLAARVVVRPSHCPLPPDDGPCAEARTLDADQRLTLSADSLGPVEPPHPEADAWRERLLVVQHRRLADIAAEISRHSPGLIRVAPSVADLRLTGTLPLAAPDLALATLTRSLPVRLVKRANGLWTDIEPSEDPGASPRRD